MRLTYCIKGYLTWLDLTWFLTNNWLWNRSLVQCRQQFRPSSTNSTKCRRPFIAQTVTHHWILSITASVDGFAEETEQNLIVRTGKSEAEVTNNKRVRSMLRSRYCTIKSNYWQTRSIVRPLCYSRASCAFTSLLAAWRKILQFSIHCYVNLRINIRHTFQAHSIGLCGLFVNEMLKLHHSSVQSLRYRWGGGVD